MRYITLVTLIIFVSFVCYSQSSSVTIVLDTALVNVGYDRFIVLDTLNPQNVKKDYLTLQSGRNASVFYSEQRRLEDNLMAKNPDYTLEIFKNNSMLEKVSKLEKEVIIRRYDIDQTWSHLRFDLTNWILYESLEKPNWVITDETDIILGFPCIKATTNFRGREWIAFFTPDIPVQEGPWKLYGLPGLILKAYDSKRHYFYEAKDINSKSPGLVEYVNDCDRLVLKERIKSLRLRNEAKKKDIRQIMAHAFGIKIKLNQQMKKEDEAAKNHDFEETDYPHQ